MGERATNTGDEPSNTPGFDQPTAAALATINRRLAVLTDDVKNIAQPPLVSAGNVISVLAALMVLVIAAIGAFALSDRINHVNDHVDRVEDKLSEKLDKLSDQFSKMNDRSLILEGRFSAAPSPPSNKPQVEH